jgi:hypothetical protein
VIELAAKTITSPISRRISSGTPTLIIRICGTHAVFYAEYLALIEGCVATTAHQDDIG